MLDRLNQLNSFPIKPVSHEDFRPFGRVLTQYDFAPALGHLSANTPLPQEGNCYLASDPALEALPVFQALQDGFFGTFPLQIGYCNGQNTRLNALEYHRGSEVDVAATPLVLLLASLTQVVHNALDTSLVQGFYLPAGTAVELFGTTLHFSPCKVEKEGFRSLIILPRGTNLPLPQGLSLGSEEDRLLWMTNKWLLAHRDSVPASKGALVGLTGPNLEVYY